MTFQNRDDVLNSAWDRRRFLEFMGKSAVFGAGAGTLASLAACAGKPKALSAKLTARDEVVLPEGMRWSLVAKWGDWINPTERFGFNCDYTAFLPDASNPNEGTLWVNHEYVHPLFVSGVLPKRGEKRKAAQVRSEQLEVGGSILRVRRSNHGEWKLVPDHPLNRRVTGLTPIRFSAGELIRGSDTAIGTVGNCGGGVTPWGTVLSCEENHFEVYGDRDYTGGKPGGRITLECVYGWETVVNYPPEHYGWVVEVDPRTGSAKKLVSLGRFGHESATVRAAADGRCVVYSGDDAADRCLYKFIADKAGSLDSGTLYVANVEKGSWIPLTRSTHAVLQSTFVDQQDVLVRARLAAVLVGGSRLDRPEDIDIEPRTGAVFVALSNNRGSLNDHGSILKIVERGGDPLALEFTSETFITGGPDKGMSCPDNLAFDPNGNLWICSDISGGSLGKSPYEAFPSNGLYYVRMTGTEAGLISQVASAPIQAEFTGPTFTPDGRTLFLSVQHPGEETTRLEQLTSNWPDGGSSIPRSAVLAIHGKALETLTA